MAGTRSGLRRSARTRSVSDGVARMARSRATRKETKKVHGAAHTCKDIPPTSKLGDSKVSDPVFDVPPDELVKNGVGEGVGPVEVENGAALLDGEKSRCGARFTVSDKDTGSVSGGRVVGPTNDEGEKGGGPSGETDKFEGDSDSGHETASEADAQGSVEDDVVIAGEPAAEEGFPEPNVNEEEPPHQADENSDDGEADLPPEIEKKKRKRRPGRSRFTRFTPIKKRAKKTNFWCC